MEKRVYNSSNEVFSLLIDTLSKNDLIQSIGKTGAKELPQNNDSDVDIFIFSEQVPKFPNREKIYTNIEKFLNGVEVNEQESKHWGFVDFLKIDKIEVCLMYFSVTNMKEEIVKLLNGDRLEKEENYFYPIGRCATIKTLNILYDKNNFLSNLQKQLAIYPNELYTKSIEHHLSKINDKEDFGRAITRKDVLFYHFVLDIALDHYLQLLFAVNKNFFPSRKRSIEHIDSFKIKPVNCGNRILEVLLLGGNENELKESYIVWEKLCNDLENLVNTKNV